MSLFKVGVSYETVIEASSEKAAQREAKKHAAEDVVSNAPTFTATEIANEADVPEGWMNTVPWGSESKIKSILKEQAATAEAATAEAATAEAATAAAK
jgi:hypothetical protein